MPRTGKNQVAPGEPHGHRQHLEEQMAAAPMADEPGLHARAVEGATAMAPPPPGGLLRQPSSRPDEPITAGLPIGAGPGPEAVKPLGRPKNQQLAQQLNLAAELTGNPRLQKMARRMRPRQGNQGL